MSNAILKPLAGKRAIVTGGAKNIGLHFARALAGAGASVALGDVANGDAAAGNITAGTGKDCFYRHLDVSNEDSVVWNGGPELADERPLRL